MTAAPRENVVALIAARGGSKGIPTKNLADFCGKPLVAWSVEQARSAEGVASVWVSSDSEEILEVCRAHGAEGIERPAELSTDESSSEAAWLHAIDEIEARAGAPDLVVALQATSPLREPADVERGLHDFDAHGCDSLFSASRLEDFFIWRREADGTLTSVNYDYRDRKRRQDVAKQFVENGSFYVFPPALIRAEGNRLGGTIGMSLMEFWKSFEIDTAEDLETCEALMRHYLLREGAA